MFLTSSSAYAIRAMVYLAAQPEGRLCGAKEISEHEQIPPAFLWKILQVLRQHQLLRSMRGSRGGYCLAPPPSEIRLSEIVEALEGAPEPNRCELSGGNCSSEQPCAIHRRLGPVREHFQLVMAKTTLDEVSRAVQQ